MILTSYISGAVDSSDCLLGVHACAESALSTAQSLSELALRFFLNLLSCWIIVRFLYYPKSRRRDYVFTFLAFSSAMLLLLYAMERVNVEVGLTLGLFAIFGVIRYRTETVPIREMTYLFIIIAIAAVNGLTPLYKFAGAGPDGAAHYTLGLGDVVIAVCANALAIILIWILESSRSLRRTSSKLILYDRIDLIVPEKRGELFKDLEQRCGIVPTDVEIGNIDFLKDSAYIRVYYKSESKVHSTVDSIVKYGQFVDNQNYE